MTLHINSLSELDNLIQKADANRLFVMDFYATWCGPCQFIAPYFDQLPASFQNASFIKINVDQAREISVRYNVQAMPTFVLVKNRQEVDRIRGANQQALQAAITQHYSNNPANPNAATENEKKFLEKFVPYCEQIKKYYDNSVYKSLALSVIPYEELKQKSIINGKVDRILLLTELINWFKNQFFKWCDSPICEQCGIQTEKGKGLQGTPLKDELEYGAKSVEVYECKNCNKEVRFPRYNNPAKLLETRKGRCGEWANCFTMMATAMGYETRFILDTTDHVWTEVYSDEQKRWIHCDPCENVIDKPLMYEKGWNKKLSYVIAYGIDHVVDVTWRYVIDSKTALSRRQVRQEVFNSFLMKLNNRQGNGISANRKKQLVERRLVELFELLINEKNKKHLKNEDFGGRTTGSEEWRRNRGEIGNVTKEEVEENKKIVIELPEENGKFFEISYKLSTDCYTTNWDNGTIEGFRELTYECKNIIKKTENDWKKMYFCRRNGEEDGVASWHFNLTEKSIKKLEIVMNGCENFDKGKVFVVACLSDSCMKLPKNGKLTLESPDSGILKITTTLTGGSGSNAFQSAQFFRQSLDSSISEPDFSVKIWLN